MLASGPLILTFAQSPPHRDANTKSDHWAMLDVCATYALSRAVRGSATRSQPAGSVPEEQETTVVHRPEGRGMLHPLRAAARVIDQKIGWNRIGLALSSSSSGRPRSCSTACCAASRSAMSWRRCDQPNGATSCWPHCSWRRLFHAHLLRSVRAAYDRREPRSVSRCGACRLYQLFDRPQHRGERVHRRRGALSRLLGLGADRDRCRESLFHRGLTFWLGNVTVLGLGIAFEPQAASAIDHLPVWFNRVLGIVALAFLAAMSRGCGSSRASSAAPTGW